MNDGDVTRDHAGHPEDLLATYVEGAASAEERATVEALLSACTECRREVDLAVQARAVLQSLPEVEAPTLRVKGVVPSAPAARGWEPSRRGVLSRVREWTSERLAWGAGLVAVGSLVALFVLVQSSGRPASEQAAPAQRAAPGSDLGGFAGGRNHGPGSLDALARRLAASERVALSTEQQPAPAATTERTAAPPADVADRARDCLRRGGGLPARARPIHVEEGAFRGVPAFIGAFESGPRGGRRYLLVLAVDRGTCDALYVINRSV